MRLARHHINTAIYLFASLLAKAASLLLIPLYTARLTPAEYGTYGLAQTIYWIGAPIISLSLSQAIMRFYFDTNDAKTRDQILGELGWNLVWMAGGSCVLLELVMLVYPALHLGDLHTEQLRLVAITCAALAINEIPLVALRAAQRAGLFAAFNLSIFAVTAGCSVIFMVKLHWGLNGLLAGTLAGQLVCSLVAIGYLLKLSRPVFGGSRLRGAIAYSVPFIPHSIGNSLMQGVDRWALEMNGFKTELGHFTLASQLTVPIPIAVSAWNEASAPTFLAAWRDGGVAAARAKLPRIVAGFLASSGGTLLLILCGLPILRIFVGDKYAAALPLVPLIGATLIVGTLFSAFVNVLFLQKDTRLIPVLTFSSVLVNVAFNVALVPRFGVYGAIVSTGLAQTFRAGVMAGFARRALRVAA